MELKEFIDKGYKIYAQAQVVETREINLSDLSRHQPIDECEGDVIDTWTDDNVEHPVSYDILDPSGDLISGYHAKLFTGHDVAKFIEGLSGENHYDKN